MGFIGILSVCTTENTVLLLISLSVYCIVTYIILHETGGYILSPALVFHLFFTVFIFIAGLRLFLTNGEGAFYGGGIRNYPFFVALTGGLGAFGVGIFLSSGVLNFSPKYELIRYRRKPLIDRNQITGDIVTMTIIGLVALLFTGVYILNRGSIPLFEVIHAMGSPDIYEVAAKTRAAFSRYGSDAGSYFYQGYFQQFYLVILPFVTLYVGAKYLYYRKQSLKWIWIILGILCSFFLTMSLQRWPLMFFLVLNFILYTNYLGRIKTSHSLVFVSIALIFFALITFVRGIENLEVLGKFIVSRIFDVQGNVFYSIFELFPEHYSFFGGRGILGDIIGIIPGPHPGFTRWLYDTMFRVYGTGTAPTIFWGQLYADFGLMGVITGSLLAGFAMQAVYIHQLRREKTLLSLIVFSFITMALGELAITNLIIILFQLGIVTVLLLVVTLNVSRWVFQSTAILETPIHSRLNIA